MISARVVADSYFQPPFSDAARLTTLELVYPRFIHSELMTHRVFSRNAASSRAIPIETMMAAVSACPAMPVSWGRNQKGMQARETLEGDDAVRATTEWLNACHSALEACARLAATGVHKQVANRVLEPYVHMQTVVSATEWMNFFAQRAHEDADPTFEALAEAALAAMNASKPKYVPMPGYWHLPYVDPEEVDALGLDSAKKVAVVRCARVSYARQGQSRDLGDDLQRFESLVSRTPGHWSPLEHVAVSTDDERPGGNFRHWKQFRKFFSPAENITWDPRLANPYPVCMYGYVACGATDRVGPEAGDMCRLPAGHDGKCIIT